MTDCLFCAIAAGEIPADVVGESERCLAFRDITPQAPTHVLVISREHFPNAAELVGANPGLAAELLALATDTAQNLDVADSGYRVVFNTGPDGGQSVDHVHAHVLGGRALSWPPG